MAQTHPACISIYGPTCGGNNNYGSLAMMIFMALAARKTKKKANASKSSNHEPLLILQRLCFLLLACDKPIFKLPIQKQRMTLLPLPQTRNLEGTTPCHSHVDSTVVTKIIKAIEEKFGDMTVSRGKSHVFLGMDIDFHADGTANIKMKEYIKEAISDFGQEITRSATSPAKRDLFEIKEESRDLTEKDREIFHSVVAKLLYVSIRGRLSIILPIAFLCTRVACSTEQDWTKLKRVLEYLNGTIDDF